MTLDAAPSSPGDAFLDALAARMAPLMAPLLAPLLLAGLRHTPGLGSPEYATAKQNPLGSKKAFRAACRARAFPTFLRNRATTAKWEDVAAWMCQRPGAPAAAGERTLEEEMEIAFAPKKRRRKAA